MIALCPDCDRSVEIHAGRCPFCGNASLGVPGGIGQTFAKRLPWLQRVKAAKPVAALQTRFAAFVKFRRVG